MAITHATIQHRRGALKDFDASKMKPGELAVTTDGSRKVLAAFAAGDVKELASKEEVQQAITDGITSIEEKEQEVIQNINTGVEAINSTGEAQTNAVNEAAQKAMENIGNGVDATLSTEGKAADAKMTGDKITELKEDMVNKQNALNIKFLYESTKNPDDYIAGLASGKMYLLNNGAINPCINIPVFVQKGDLIKSVQCYKKSIKSFNFILLKKQKTNSATFKVIKKFLMQTNKENILDIVADDDYFVGVESIDDNAIVRNNVELQDTTNGFFYYANTVAEGDTTSFVSDATPATYNVDVIIAKPVKNDIVQNRLTVGANECIFTNPVICMNAIHDSAKNNQYNVYINSGTYDIMTELGGESYFNTITSDMDAMECGLVIPDYVNLYGIGDVIFKGEIPSDKANSLLSTKISTINSNKNNIIENITFTAKNLRYACHDETSANVNLMYRKRTIRNCRFIHYDNDSGLWSSIHGYAAGLMGGDEILFENCEFSSVSFHDQKSDMPSSKVKYVNCRTWREIKCGSVGANNKHKCEIIGCSIGTSVSNIEETTGSIGKNSWEISGYGNTQNLHNYLDKFPFFSDEISYRTSASNNAIPKGTAVKLQSGAVTPLLAEDSKDAFYGITIEDIPPYRTGYGAVKFSGYISKEILNLESIAHFSYVSWNGEKFINDASNPILYSNYMSSNFAKIIN